MNQQESLIELEELRRKVAQLEESETRYRMFLETADEAVIVTQEGMVKWANPKATAMSGYTEQELLSIPFSRIIHPDDRERVMQYHGRRMRGNLDKKSYQLRIVTKSGIIKWVQQNTSTISWEGRPAGLGLLTDISEQKHLEENLRRAHDELEKRIEERTVALREANEKLCLEVSDRIKAEEALRLEREQLLAIFDSIDEVISVIDSETYQILYANKFMRDRHSRELIGGVCYKDLHGLTKPCDHCTKEIVSRLKGKPYRWDYHNPTTNGDYLATDRIIKWSDGRDAKFHLGIDVTERKKAEEALRESERRFRELAELLPEPVVQFDLTGTVTFASHRAFETFGYSREDLSRGISVFDVIVPEDSDKIRENMRRLLNREEHGREEYTCVRKDSTQFPAFIHSTVRVSNDAVVGVTSIVVDLSERRRTEVALRESEERFKQVAENADEWIWEVDANGMYQYCSSAVERILGYSPDELVGKKHFFDLFAPEVREDLKEAALSAFERRETLRNFVYPNIHKNGEIRLLETSCSPVQNEKGALLGYRGADTDVTERKQTEEALRASEERLELALRGADLGLWDWDLKTGRGVCNERALDMLGYMNGEVDLNLFSWKDMVHPEDWPRVSETLTAHIEGRAPSYESEYRLRSKSGEWKWILARGKSAAFDTDGRPLRMTGTILDITERKSAEQEREVLRAQLAQSQKMQAIGTLTGGLSHDFNNLLTIINGYTEMILSEKSEDDPSYSDLQKILETGHKGAELVQRLLAFSKNADISLRPLNLNLIVENSVGLVARTFPKMIEIETVIGKDLSMVNADMVQVQQVLINLFINANEAMPDGGKIRIETSNASVDWDYCRRHLGAKPGQHVLIEVADAGRGMDANTLGRIFDPFFTTKGWDFKKGTGLGLSVAKGIVEQHGGWITCYSEQGKGTTFRVYFPIIEDSLVVEQTEPLAEAVPSDETILFVDDEEYVRDLGKRILERSGYTVITAANGKEALEIYARKQPNIALVVLDLIMPQMGGEQCLEDLVRINPDVKLVVSSGHSLAPKERDLLITHVKGFVDKPYQMKQFLEVVREVLGYE